MKPQQSQGVVLDVRDTRACRLWRPLAQVASVRALVDLARAVSHRYVVIALHGGMVVHASTARGIHEAALSVRAAHAVIDTRKPDGGTTPWLLAVRPLVRDVLTGGLPRAQ
ncbi:MAG: hypothetical protein AB1761_16800 [Pseudomonadota bacterium]